ncbi:MAG: hypothetical protein F6J90_15895 [Moorea sp. SIOASIH]|uniref:hypothetical protein n=1 Tax=Moorena sp. SIOASIH TaxID=2607817 RepID=UPI0013BC1107|nr:hypothetical protein [Moorena sp. SIOASIH]NEO37731.1 hypothetical protein [Moorena sp. SIOASIH]
MPTNLDNRSNAHQYPTRIVGWALRILIMIENRSMTWAMPTNIDNRRVGIADQDHD